MEDTALKNSQDWLRNLDFQQENDWQWYKPEHTAKTPGVGIIPEQYATILKPNLITTYLGTDENNELVSKPLPEDKWHYSVSFSFIKRLP